MIDFSNIKDGLFSQKSFLKKRDIKKYYDKPELGIPIIFPTKLKEFNYKGNYYQIEKNTYKKKIFGDDNNVYTISNNCFKYGKEFAFEISPKKNYSHILSSIKNINLEIKEKIFFYKKKKLKLGAFQTRNIPHLGHEKIIQMLLENCDIVFINPVIGPKKKGDVKSKTLMKLYDFLNKKYYNNKLIFSPVCANMFYAGPREAIHHSIIRSNLGFDYFVVGRDHAGALDFYPPFKAIKYIKKYCNKLKINVLTHYGAYYSKKYKKFIILHNNNKNDLINIKGTDFRKSILKRKIFKFARKDLQKYLFDLGESFFY